MKTVMELKKQTIEISKIELVEIEPHGENNLLDLTIKLRGVDEHEIILIQKALDDLYMIDVEFDKVTDHEKWGDFLYRSNILRDLRDEIRKKLCKKLGLEKNYYSRKNTIKEQYAESCKFLKIIPE